MFEGTHHHRWIRVVLAGIFVGAMLIQCIGAWQDSQTTDEAVHLSAGVVYWRTGYWLLNPEHPPLVKLLAATPLLPFHWLNLPSVFSSTVESNQWQIGANMLYRSATNLEVTQWLMFFGRLPIIILWAALGWLIWHWSQRWWGELGGLISTSLYLFDPNFLGHGHLVTTDVGAALGFAAVLWCAWRVIDHPTRAGWWWFGLVFGLAQVTKFSLLILWLIIPILGLLALWHRRPGWNPKSIFKMLGMAALGSVVVIWLSYGLEIRRPSEDPRVARLWREQAETVANPAPDTPTFVSKLAAWAEPTATGGKFVRDLATIPIPAYSYWRGVSALLSHNYFGHAAFLWGQFGFTGWWWYFPVTVLFKTPVLTLALMVGTGLVALTRYRIGRRWPWHATVLLAPPLLYFAWSMTSHINIGVRHILPIYPLAYIALGGLAIWLRRPWRLIVASSVIGISAIVAISAYPNTIGYFNFLAGGTQGGHRYLLDSNLDWNQDIWRLRAWLDQHRVTDYQLALFGSIPAGVIFPEAKPVLLDADIKNGIEPHGYIVISAGQLYNVPGPFHWLQTETPVARVGSSILIYRFDASVE